MVLTGNVYRIVVGRPEGKISSSRPRHRWEDKIKMDLREVGCDAGHWVDLVQDKSPMAFLCKGDDERPGSLVS